MKFIKIVFVFLILTCSETLIAQVNIKPGIGFEQVKIGMKNNAFIALLGEPSEKRTEAEERLNYTDNNYDPTVTLPFILGFDAVYVYTNNNEYAIWKAYFKKGKLMYLNLSSYMTTIEVSTKITINDTLRFFQGASEMEAALGKDYVKVIDPDKYEVYTYVNLGIRLLFEGTKLRNVFIFKPLKGKKAARVLDILTPAVTE